MTDYLLATRRYYSMWQDVDPSCLEGSGIHTVCTQERDRPLKGYGRRFPLSCLLLGDLAIISHSESLQHQIPTLLKELGAKASIDCLKEVIEGEFGDKPGHSLIYSFSQLPQGIATSSAVQLTRDQYVDFLRFHKTQYPEGDQETWLEDYFTKIADQGLIFAVYEDGQVVSATDAPDVPYMADLIVSPGINTLESFRRKGHAKVVLAALLKYLLVLGKVPIWSCSEKNIASSRLAESVGFQQFGEMIYLSSP